MIHFLLISLLSLLSLKHNSETPRHPVIVADTIPPIAFTEKADAISAALNLEAALRFNTLKVPSDRATWDKHRLDLRTRIWKAAGVAIDHNLPLDYRETGEVKMPGYTIKKIYFQTRPGVYATANLYIPEGAGPFPGVINMHGHWSEGKLAESVQSIGHTLVQHGYVVLSIDAWGSGERATTHGEFEYHGSNLGSSLTDLGETLLGAQVVDNMRGVDLLCSLSYVDKDKIGATGASGGGNQTMWLSAMDDRIKAGMPVVSVGTFQSYVMGSNCVCESLPGGLTFTEESGVLALVAPRALKIVNGLKDSNKAFFPSEMLRSYSNAKIIYSLYGKPENISYSVFDTPHGYWPEMRELLIGWLNLYLKGEGDGSPVKEKSFTLLSKDELMVFPAGKRDPLVMTTVEYVKRKGKSEVDKVSDSKKIDQAAKLNVLKSIVSIPDDEITKVHQYGQKDWGTEVLLETKNLQQIPLTVRTAIGKNKPAVVLLFTDKNDPAYRKEIINRYLKTDHTVVVADLFGLGANSSPVADQVDGSLPRFHTLARSSMWLGHTMQGEWSSEIGLIVRYINQHYSPSTLTIDAGRETAVAALIQAGLNKNVTNAVLRTSPISYMVDDRQGIDFFDMSRHIQGIIPWGDISLLTALSGIENITFQNPVSLSGRKISGTEWESFRSNVMKEMKAAGITREMKIGRE